MVNSGGRSGTVVVNSVTICLGHKVPRANVILGVSGRVFYFIYLVQKDDFNKAGGQDPWAERAAYEGVLEEINI